MSNPTEFIVLTMTDHGPKGCEIVVAAQEYVIEDYDEYGPPDKDDKEGKPTRVKKQRKNTIRGCGATLWCQQPAPHTHSFQCARALSTAKGPKGEPSVKDQLMARLSDVIGQEAVKRKVDLPEDRKL